MTIREGCIIPALLESGRAARSSQNASRTRTTWIASACDLDPSRLRYAGSRALAPFAEALFEQYMSC
jgi:hypothetical protein